MPSLAFLLTIVRRPAIRRLILAICLPILAVLEIYKKLVRRLGPKPPTARNSLWVDANKFSDNDEFQRVLDKLGDAGLRSTGSQAHSDFISWVESELRGIQGLEIAEDEYEILRWQTKEQVSLKESGHLTVVTADGFSRAIPIAGAVPFSLPTAGMPLAQMVYIPRDQPITASHAGKIILRDFPYHAVPYVLPLLLSYDRTSDINSDLLSLYDRPSQADGPLMQDLLQAGEAGVAGVIILFDIKKEQIESYFEPHQGVHYKVPGVFLGGVESALVKRIALQGGGKAMISIQADVGPSSTKNLSAILPGQSEEKICFVTHTDGNTQVQDDGVAALLMLAKYFASVPLSERRRTIEFNFNTAHLHISKEGSHRHAQQLDESYSDGKLALVIAVEHMGTRELEARPCKDGSPGRELFFSGRNEIMFWCTGPSPAVVRAVEMAVKRRNLDRIVMSKGTSMPDYSAVPTYASMGGIGSYYHSMCLPTTSLISGPWSLWAPFFGSSAINVNRLRDQTIALGDIYYSVDNLSRMEIESGYGGYRKRRAEGSKVASQWLSPEKSW